MLSAPQIQSESITLTADEAARRIGVSAHMLWRFRSGNEGPRYIRIGRRVLYRPADVDAWLAEMAVVRADALAHNKKRGRPTKAEAAARRQQAEG
ncbi:helix-turn-helix domain-containing protein [Nguyenibacter sp. L1]|uniref:helix-turn-helix transcriptional regulator n=1 Tax=Nguyenibacter sp. L1 TaxID=3049350 RepID=UPI002B49B695|nr:helix-turn-helix domain-containing protein [Nguyenibacter sp. L1]WRH89554.1 helix-turn-helix domain-containing protein [Nguyenibacter sp. L1]